MQQWLHIVKHAYKIINNFANTMLHQSKISSWNIIKIYNWSVDVKYIKKKVDYSSPFCSQTNRETDRQKEKYRDRWWARPNTCYCQVWPTNAKERTKIGPCVQSRVHLQWKTENFSVCLEEQYCVCVHRQRLAVRLVWGEKRRFQTSMVEFPVSQ